MSDVIVDTDVVSFLFKRDTRARLYRPHLPGQTLHLSFMTVARAGPLGTGEPLGTGPSSLAGPLPAAVQRGFGRPAVVPAVGGRDARGG